MITMDVTITEKETILQQRLHNQLDVAYNQGIIACCDMAYSWAKGGAGGNLTDEEIKNSGYYNLGQSFTNMMRDTQ